MRAGDRVGRISSGEQSGHNPIGRQQTGDQRPLEIGKQLKPEAWIRRGVCYRYLLRWRLAG
jgi:hypothetical protein